MAGALLAHRFVRVKTVCHCVCLFVFLFVFVCNCIEVIDYPSTASEKLFFLLHITSEVSLFMYELPAIRAKSLIQ